jgi:hypothetical protein
VLDGCDVQKVPLVAEAVKDVLLTLRDIPDGLLKLRFLIAPQKDRQPGLTVIQQEGMTRSADDDGLDD